ncbi:MAG: hypothetical protein C0490_00035 [Marivirga sp.]|nr:hypothetical protein [Marivirga sp.]
MFLKFTPDCEEGTDSKSLASCADPVKYISVNITKQKHFQWKGCKNLMPALVPDFIKDFSMVMLNEERG